MNETRFSRFLKNVLGTLAVGGVLFALLLVTSLIFLPKDNSPEAGEIEPHANGYKAEPQDTIDVLFVGDSEVLNSFRPREMYEDYGFTSYDCSSPGQKLPYAKHLVHRALRNQSPKVVVIETHMLYLKFSFSDAFKSEVESVLPDVTTNATVVTAIGEICTEGQGINVYDMKGVLLRQGVNPAQATQGLPTGVYVINGKKVLVK